MIAAGVLLAAVGYVGRGILRVDEHHESREGSAAGRGDRSVRRVGPTLALFLLAGFFAITIESTSIEWAAFRLADDLGASAGAAALGYVAVTAGMTAGRFGGDWATIRLGPRRLTRSALRMRSPPAVHKRARIGRVVQDLNQGGLGRFSPQQLAGMKPARVEKWAI